ncbi:dihydrofolate reductase [Rhizodiscina lignyota]|uniref:Dihydrofolate reductase n=1 Tax=Rhizodiscina lignyota TaxID=1504668 RepID=A0A9P4IVG4_9PEZI|nr:dihydrofolate reductase [Rhizodiscina lignyota]
MAQPLPTKPIKILMLHGFTQSGTLFRAKTRALEKNLIKAFPAGITLHYATAPVRLFKSDIPNWDTVNDPNAPPPEINGKDEETGVFGWWRRKNSTDPNLPEPYVYEGIEAGLTHVAEVLKQEGPFDGVLGFSQGGALAGMVASLLEPGRREAFEKAQANGGMRYPEGFEEDSGYVIDAIHPPLKFAVSYSGFGTPNPLYQGFYNPKIKTPMLHFLGSVDTVVEEKRSLRLVEACEGGRGKNGERVVYHPGGHFLPSSQRQYVGALVAFIREVMVEAEGGGAQKEEKAEDMDVPF